MGEPGVGETPARVADGRESAVIEGDLCRNGHPVDAGDLFCGECGERVAVGAGIGWTERPRPTRRWWVGGACLTGVSVLVVLWVIAGSGLFFRGPTSKEGVARVATAPRSPVPTTTSAVPTTPPPPSVPTTTSAVPTTPPPPSVPTTTSAVPVRTLPVLGRNFGYGTTGFGTVRPTQIYLGGEVTGLLRDITWHTWGSPTALGSGQALWVAPNQIVADGTKETAVVVAFDLGTCDGSPSYQKVEWYFPSEGQTFDPTQGMDTCQDS